MTIAEPPAGLWTTGRADDPRRGPRDRPHAAHSPSSVAHSPDPRPEVRRKIVFYCILDLIQADTRASRNTQTDLPLASATQECLSGTGASNRLHHPSPRNTESKKTKSKKQSGETRYMQWAVSGRPCQPCQREPAGHRPAHILPRSKRSASSPNPDGPEVRRAPRTPRCDEPKSGCPRDTPSSPGPAASSSPTRCPRDAPSSPGPVGSPSPNPMPPRHPELPGPGAGSSSPTRCPRDTPSSPGPAGSSSPNPMPPRRAELPGPAGSSSPISDAPEGPPSSPGS